MLKSLLVLVAAILIVPSVYAGSKIRIYNVVELKAQPMTVKVEKPIDPEIEQANNSHKKRTVSVDDEILDIEY